mgnify:CR=1 FL=1|tara:strand:- start:83 stop:376 length:294 start_codon:yes stop_codon:yes gene_type:complete
MEILFHRCPKGYEYFMDDFNKTTKRIWIINNRFEFSYMEGNGQPKSVWGFFKPKTGKFFAPINSKKIGKEVDITETTPFSAMQLHLNPLMSAIYGNS